MKDKNIKHPKLPSFIDDPDSHRCEMNHDDDDFFRDFNKLFQANLGKLTSGISPADLGTAWCAWILQLAQSPGHLMKLAFYPNMHAGDLINNIIKYEKICDGKDIRFQKECWNDMPWRWYAENFLLFENWWERATTDIPGLSKRIERKVSFVARQFLDAISPSNFIWTNPELLEATIESGGANVIRGTELAFRHFLSRLSGLPPPGAENFKPGRNVAITPGKIVFKNHLIELIQYEPETKTVFKEPILMIPAWIMKYYILDLSPNNSLVKWLVSKGHTVFMISWRNPGKEDCDLGMDDYYRKGAMSAIDAVSEIIPKVGIHLMGYCLGGTLAMIVTAVMAKNNDKRLKSMSLLAAQGDFTEAGELQLFISASEVSFLENMMWKQGYLDTKQMAGSFQMLRSYDLIWSKIIDDYMNGEERGMIDLLAWNADATRMPYKMHSEYLEKLFLNNDFAGGRFRVEGELAVPKDIQLPTFSVSTIKDHIAPWESVYKIHLMINSDITFVLTSGGHNAGIVSEPHHRNRAYFIQEHKKNESWVGPHRWLESAKINEGSWWPAWHKWLVKQSSPKRVRARTLAANLPAAPGKYVLQK